MKLEYLSGEVRPCSLCGGLAFTLLKSNDRYAMGTKTVGCDECGLLQTNPRPDEDALGRFYREDYRRFYQNTTTPSSEYIGATRKDVRLAYTAKFLMLHTKVHNVERLLDLGCSEGALFSALRNEGYEGRLLGVEPNEQFAKFAEQTTGAEVVSSLDKLDGDFDAIVVSHVLEHSINPQTLLREIRTRVRDGGIVYVDVPDADEYNSLADLHIAHLFHFTTRTLERMAELAGYEVVRIEKHCPPHHPKSVRLVAVKPASSVEVSTKTSRTTEEVAWMQVRRIPVARYLVRRSIAQIPYLRKFYRLLMSRGRW
ncbi:class I SAM-dependent methyltransferase [Rhizobium sp. CECT 9324]|uniref:class I SAM-dependent methyltransferase n=1 Tax=Rhizobium sp. CECT 9324 TaxID=2845820 RepID=UPI001E4A21B7|nr:class I SAM-dependent methyltransferase [Rhizobium sp. CECT 9324]CAH0343186.1 hypothetical protein RHI9324_04919 [Rhizobium sp. CECT 9324]